MRRQWHCRSREIWACDESWLKDLNPPAPLCLDLRKCNQIPAPPKLEGIRRASLPVTLATLSEQDQDAFRRELARGESAVVVLSSGGKRAALMALQHVARVEQWSPQQALENCPELAEDPRCRQLLQAYLERHRRS